MKLHLELVFRNFMFVYKVTNVLSSFFRKCTYNATIHFIGTDESRNIFNKNTIGMQLSVVR
jgi:hypothetical protein